MSKIAAICVAYGCDFKNRGKGKKSDKVVIFFEKKSSLEKVFNQVRFDGSNLLRKRFFAKVVSAESKKKSTGCAEVVVSVNTPMRFAFFLPCPRRHLDIGICYKLEIWHEGSTR